MRLQAFLLVTTAAFGLSAGLPPVFERAAELRYYEGGEADEHVEELVLDLKTRQVQASCYRDAAAYGRKSPYLSTSRICTDDDWERVVRWLTDADLSAWEPTYEDPEVRGGTAWRLALRDESGREIRRFSGANAFPGGFGDFYRLKRFAMKLRDPVAYFPERYLQKARRNYISDNGQLIVYGPDFRRTKTVDGRRCHPVILLDMRYFEVGRPEVVWCEVVAHGNAGDCTVRAADGSLELADRSSGYDGDPSEAPIDLTLIKGAHRGVIHLNAVPAKH